MEKVNPAEDKRPAHHLKHYLFLLILMITFAGLTSFLNLKGFSQDIRSKASVDLDREYCVNQPSCCNDIIAQYQQKGDITDLPDEEQPYHACPGLYDANNERGYCRMDICNQLPSGVKYRGRCGWYWVFHDGATNSPNGYGCMIGDSEASMVPKYTPSGATVTPKPLYSPTPLPTAIPPTQVIPTSTPVIILPSITPRITATPLPTISYNATTTPFTVSPSPTAIAISNTQTPYPSRQIIVTTGITTQPSISNPQPTISGSLPISTPQPTTEPVWPKIRNGINVLWKNIQTETLKFLSLILP